MKKAVTSCSPAPSNGASDAAAGKVAAPDYPYRFRWTIQKRKGQSCRVAARGRRTNSILVEFEDGGRLVTHANAVVRRAEYRDSAQVRAGKIRPIIR